MAEEGEEAIEALDPYKIVFEGSAEELTSVKKDGKATASYPNKDTFTGVYKDGKRNGQGTYTWTKANATYTGNYVDNLKDGEGTMTYPDKTKYTGQWLKGKRHGHGLYEFANGDKYCGAYTQGLKSGKGSYIYAKDKTQFTGTWQNGKCKEGAWTYFDEKVKPEFPTFTAFVRGEAVTKYQVDQME